MNNALFTRAANDNGPSSISAPWPAKDIAYVAVVGTVMLAALLEWFLWLAAFLYCLAKVFQKANGDGKWGIRILAVLTMIIFTALRAVFLPVMVVTLPLPPQIVQYFPQFMVRFLQWFAFWTFSALLTIPWLICVYQLVTHSIGRTSRIKHVLDEHSAPKVVIIMPCYNEEPRILLRTVDSIVDCDYPPSCLHVFLSFDGDEEGELYLNTLDSLGVPLALDNYPKSIDVIYRSCRITVSRFPHGGKRQCQKRSFKLIDKVYAEYLRRNDNLFLLFIDSDCILDSVCIQNFMYEMELKPGSKRNMLAMTGVITSTTEKNSLLTLLQDMEYIHGQLFERCVESGCGAVTCLPGALTILRFSAFRKMAKYYFADKAEQCDDLFDYGKCHLGEDRWLTHLFMIGAKERYQIQMNTGAFCKTEAVQTFKSLLKQRRRWFLGFITNEACMLTDVRLWKRYPLLCIIRLAQNTIRTTALLFFIMVISLLTTSQKIANLPVGFIAVSLGLNWVLMLYFGAKLGRYKIMLYPIMFVINPFFNWLYMVYGIFTAGQRTWGGPRADAGVADTETTPADAVAHAEATGDDLNVVPETFKPAIEASTLHKRHVQPAPLLPSGHLEGRFAPAEELPGGWYRQTNDSGMLHADMTPRSPHEPTRPMTHHPHWWRESTESLYSTTSYGNSVYQPRRVESIFAPEDARIYHDRQALQMPAGGAYYETEAGLATRAGGMQEPERARRTYVPAFSTHPLAKGSYTESVNSVASDESVGMHFGDPSSLPSQARMRSSVGEDAYAAVPAASTSNDHLPAPLSDASLNVPGPLHARDWSTQSSQLRTGRSPLARKSFTRSAADDAPTVPVGELRDGIELRDRRRSRSEPREAALDGGEEGPPTRRGRRLTKTRPVSGRDSSSRG